jgi:hypothetical protein
MARAVSFRLENACGLSCSGDAIRAVNAVKMDETQESMHLCKASKASQVATLEIYALAAAYWHDVDRNGGKNAHLFFSEDGVFDMEERLFTGRRMISEFYKWRRDRGARASRHLISNLNVTVLDDRTAEVEWIMSIYAADGVAPLPSAPPIYMGDVWERCVRDGDGPWQYAHRKLTAVFKGGVATTIPSKDVALLGNPSE